MPTYNKLVRDRIPEIIEKARKAFTTRILNDKEYEIELKKKMYEELNEYEEANNDDDALEELADLLELINAATILHGSNLEQLEEIRKKKAEKRGGFEEKIFLIEVEDD